MDDHNEQVTLIQIGDVPQLIKHRTGGAVDRTLETVRDWCSRGVLDSKKMGGRRFVTLESIDAFIKGGINR